MSEAKHLHAAVLACLADHPPTDTELWDLLRRYSTAALIPESAVDLNVALYIVRFYRILERETWNPRHRNDLAAMRRDMENFLDVSDDLPDEELDAYARLPPIRRRFFPVLFWRRPKPPPPARKPMRLKDAEAAAPAAATTIDHALARLFIRLGPPPEPTTTDYAPAGSNGGGAQQ